MFRPLALPTTYYYVASNEVTEDLTRRWARGPANFAFGSANAERNEKSRKSCGRCFWVGRAECARALRGLRSADLNLRMWLLLWIRHASSCNTTGAADSIEDPLGSHLGSSVGRDD